MAKKETLLLDKNYKDFLRDIKCKIISARISAARRINKELIKLYWDIGKVIIERQEKYGWGRSVIEKLEKDLKKEFGNTKGFSSRNLWYMRCFYLEYKAKPILQQLVAEIPWSHAEKGTTHARAAKKANSRGIMKNCLYCTFVKDWKATGSSVKFGKGGR